MKVPALRHQPAQQRRQVFQVPGNQVAHLAIGLGIALPDTVNRQQARA